MCLFFLLMCVCRIIIKGYLLTYLELARNMHAPESLCLFGNQPHEDHSCLQAMAVLA